VTSPERPGSILARPLAEIYLVAALSPSRRWLKALSVLARPVARFGHEWILDTGARQFSERAL
jgi:hypothetical protein